ncbi:hypothetical protein VXQ18_12730 [Brucella abortus]|nr:hypothetical protein [Brucella abortus]
MGRRWTDDRYELSEIIRLGSQLLAAITVLYGLGPDFRLLPNLLPYWLEATLIVFALIIAINVTNFMDGLDLMTVAGLGVPLVGIALLGALGLTGLTSSGIGAVAAGGLLGFAPVQPPACQHFLGDSGSSPIGVDRRNSLCCCLRVKHTSWSRLFCRFAIFWMRAPQLSCVQPKVRTSSRLTRNMPIR